MKIILFANTDWYLYNFRLELAEALVKTGHEVLLLSPDGPYRSNLQAAGYNWVEFPISRRGMNPLKELLDVYRLWRFYRQEKPDLVHHFTIKCVLYGSSAAHWAGVKKVVNSIEGLGYIFTNQSWPIQFLRLFVLAWYRWILKKTKVIFLNEDDQAFFFNHKLVAKENGVLIPGSGVDIDKFMPAPNLPSGIPVVVLAGRMLFDKGVSEYVEAARQLKQKGIPGRFALVGNIDQGNPAAISMAQIEAWQTEGVIEWWGWHDQMSEVYHQASIVCLPSYREGLPKMLIEAGACGVPLVVTDIPGCRDVVWNGENGLLVPPKDEQALADALEELLLDPKKRKLMGSRNREIVTSKFSIRDVVEKILAVYEIS